MTDDDPIRDQLAEVLWPLMGTAGVDAADALLPVVQSYAAQQAAAKDAVITQLRSDLDNRQLAVETLAKHIELLLCTSKKESHDQDQV